MTFQQRLLSFLRNVAPVAPAAARLRRGPETLEPRCLMAADVAPIEVAIVYAESDDGTDRIADEFYVTFRGGAPGTELREIRVNTDGDLDGLSRGDLIFDTEAGGLGIHNSHGVEVSSDVQSVAPSETPIVVEDGGTALVLQLAGLTEGEVLRFTVDVDEIQRLEPVRFFDAIASGAEFNFSIFEFRFDAPHYHAATSGDDPASLPRFLNDYSDDPIVATLDLPQYESAPTRNAAASARVTQRPLPVSISGTVWLDEDLDLIRTGDEARLSGVELALYRRDEATGEFLDTGHRTLTDASGQYLFDTDLDLQPGQFEVRQTQPPGLFSVGAVAGRVAGEASGVAESANVLTSIEIRDGGTAATGYDFAEASPVSLSGHVYVDVDDDGNRDAGEQGIAGVSVRLEPVDTIAPVARPAQPTDAQGRYRFDNLPPGRYRVVEVSQPDGYFDGLDSAGTVAGRIVGTAGNDVVDSIDLRGGEAGIEYNFGELLPGSISGFLYFSRRGEVCSPFTGDIHQSHFPDEPLAGVTVELRGSDGTFLTTVSDARGFYQFQNLPKGEYEITEITPQGVLKGKAFVGTIDGRATGSAASENRLSQIRLAAGDDSVLNNFCNGRPATISGHVYHDAANNGVRDAGDATIAGADVMLRDAAGVELRRTRTDGDGFYEFAGLNPGDYVIEETTPAPYLDGTDSAGNVFGETRGVAENPGDRIAGITLRQGELGVEYDFGELLGATISGFVHAETDGDCVRDPGENVLSGVTIRLIDAAGNEVAVTQTDVQGRYQFSGLRPGRYSTVQEQPAEFYSGGQTAGSTGGDTAIENEIRAILVASGEDSIENNFCEHPYAQLSGVVYTERDGDCVREAGEPGIAGVRVDLFDADGRLVASTMTDQAGGYRFEGLQHGRYLVREHQPGGFFHGGQRAGSAGGDASQPDSISAIEIGIGELLVDYNFCELEPAAIAGQVFVDANDDCVRQASERGVGGVRIDLLDAGGRLVASTQTGAEGGYHFDGLRPGEYTVVEHQPQGLFHGGQFAGSAGGDDSVADTISAILVGAGAQLVNYDFCEHGPVSLQGQVFADINGDCHRQAGEQPLEGVKIDLVDSVGTVIASTTTDADGQYRFAGLAPGEYRVQEHQPTAYFQGGQVAGSAGGDASVADVISAIFLSGGVNAVGYDFCEVPGSSLEGRVWSETDLNGRHDAGDAPLRGVAIDLLDANGSVVRQTTTDAVGRYRFENLEPGRYTVREMGPAALFHGGQRAGSAGGDATRADVIAEIDLAPAVQAVEYNFYEFPPATISGFVFQDGPSIATNGEISPEDLRQFRDGKRTADDTALAGVVLELRNVAGQPIDASRALPGRYASGPIRVVTDENGYYEFGGLRPGTFHVYQVQPEGWIDGLDTAGTTGGYAVNAADQPDLQTQIVLLTLAADENANPGNDAIINVSVTAGGASRENNFSEVTTLELPGWFAPPPSIDPPPVVPPPDNFASPPPAMVFPEPIEVRAPMIRSGGYRLTWHLSVINGGHPRGQSLNQEPPAPYRRASLVLDAVGWDQLTHNSGTWQLLDRDGNPLEISSTILIGDARATAVAGDFDGDGTDSVGLFIHGHWFLDLNGNGRWDAGDLWVHLGSELDSPVVGDWDGDGKDDIGIFGPEWHRDAEAILHDPGLPKPDNFRQAGPKNPPPTVHEATNGQRLLRHGKRGDLRADLIDHVFRYGHAADTPLAGDWNGDGIDAIAVFHNGRWMLDRDGDGRWTRHDLLFEFGESGDVPIVGDWNGDGIDDLGVRRGQWWIIDSDGDRRLTDADDRIHQPDASGAQGLAGDWDGDGRDTPGTYAAEPIKQTDEPTEDEKRAA